MLVIPDWLALRPFRPDDCSLLVDFANQFGIQSFSEIDLEMLRNSTLSTEDLPTFFKLVRVLGLYGVEFSGALTRYSRPAGRNPILLDFPNGDSRLLQESSLDRRAVISLNSFTIKRLDSLRGLGLDLLSDLIQVEIDDLMPGVLSQGGRIVDSPSSLQYFYAPPEPPVVPVLEPEEPEPEPSPPIVGSPIPFSQSSIQILGLGVRAVNVLMRNRITTVGELAQLSTEEILAFKNCGKDTAKQIADRLAEFVSTGHLNIKEIAPQEQHQYSSEEYEALKQKFDPAVLAILEELALDNYSKLRAVSFGTFVLLIGKEKGVQTWSLINNTTVSDDQFIGLNGERTDPSLFTCPINENPLFDQIQSMSLSQSTKSALQANGYNFFWQVCFVPPKELAKRFDIRIWDEFLAHALRAGITNIPLQVNPAECLVSQILRTTIEFEKRLPEILNPREFEVFSERRLSASKPTLDELGRKHNVTRERIRQIEARALKSIQRAYAPILLPLKREVSELLFNSGSVTEWHNYVLPVETRNTINHLFDILEFAIQVDEHANLIWHGPFLQAIADSDSSVYELIAQEATSNLESQLSFLSFEDIRESAAAILAEFSTGSTVVPSDAVIDLVAAETIHQHFTQVSDNSYRRKTVAFIDLVPHEFGQCFPKGAFIYKAGEEIWATLCAAIPGLEKRGGARYMQRVLTDDKNILFWDTGFYIHKQHVNPDMTLVDEIIADCIAEFDNGIPDLKIHLLFDRKKQKLIAGGIPTSAALYSLMRLVEPPRLDLGEYPRIRDVATAAENLKQTDLVEQYVKENSPVSKHRIAKHFTERGWRQSEIEQTLSRCTGIMRVGTNYVHVDEINVSNDAVKKLVAKIEEELKLLAHFNVRHLRSKYPILWNAVCDRNLDPHSMEKVLSTVVNPNFKISRLQVSLESTEEKGLSKEITDWVKAVGDYVSMDQLEKEFSHQRGYKPQSIRIALYWSELLCCYERCYVHPEVIGCTASTVETIKQILLDASRQRAKEHLPHVPYSWLIDKYYSQLPPLNEPFDWTIQLLNSIAEPLDIAHIFYQAYVLKENDFHVGDFDDLIGYIIGTIFGDYRSDIKKIENYAKSQSLIDLGATLRKDELFFDGSSVELIEEGQAIMLSAIGRQRYIRA